MEEKVGWQILWPGIMWSKLKIETFGLKSTCRNKGRGNTRKWAQGEYFGKGEDKRANTVQREKAHGLDEDRGEDRNS